MALPDILSSLNLITPSLAIRLVAAIVIIIIGFILARIANKLIKKVLHELEVNRILREKANIKIKVEEIIASAIKYIIYFIAIIWALNQVGLTTTVLHIILGIILILLVVFMILAFKDFIPNIMAWFVINQRKKFKEGDRIKVKDIEGTIIKIDLLETKIRTKKHEIVFIPNSILTKHEVIRSK
jgi:small conductance mechanosensitive channel